MKGTWQTSDSGAGGLVAIVAVLLIIAIVAGPVAAAVAELVRLVLIAVAVLAAVTVAGIGFLVWRARRARPAPFMSAAEVRAVQARSASRREIPAPQVHVHLHGPVDGEQLAAIIGQQQDAVRQSIEEKPW